MSFQILNTKVIFSGRTTKNGKNGHYLTYDQIDINIGGGLTGSSDFRYFKAPIAGIYKMTFTGQLNHLGSIHIWVAKTDGNVMKIYESNTAENDDGNIVSYTWMMELKANDYVGLLSREDFYASDEFPLTFAGELIHIN